MFFSVSHITRSPSNNCHWFLAACVAGEGEGHCDARQCCGGRSAFLTEYVTFQPCVQSITQSRRQPGNEPISMHVIYSESEEAAASSASMLGTPVIRSSLPPPSLPFPSLPSFSLPSSGPPQMLRLFASLKVQRPKRKRQVSVHSTLASLFGDLCAIRTVWKFGLRWRFEQLDLLLRALTPIDTRPTTQGLA